MQGKSAPDRQLLDAAAFCRGLIEDHTIYSFLADQRDELFKDEDFADLFPSGKGRPSVPAVLVCSVMVLQALEGLSDRDAIRQLRTRIDWKVACGSRSTTLASTSPCSPTGAPAFANRSGHSGSSRPSGLSWRRPVFSRQSTAEPSTRPSSTTPSPPRTPSPSSSRRSEGSAARCLRPRSSLF